MGAGLATLPANSKQAPKPRAGPLANEAGPDKRKPQQAIPRRTVGVSEPRSATGYAGRPELPLRPDWGALDTGNNQPGPHPTHSPGQTRYRQDRKLPAGNPDS